MYHEPAFAGSRSITGAGRRRTPHAAPSPAPVLGKGKGPLNSSDEREREVEALRERISSLSGAVLRISASLDVGTVLREVVDSARALTGARYGAITTIDEAGRPQDFVTSGLTADEQRQLEAWPHAMRFFEHLRDLPGPLRLPDLPAYLRSLGYADVLALSRTLQATPMRHRGVHVGDFFLGEKEGGREFTADDEEILVLFASQAANAIANARAHRDERRARADLEALVETSPVGVVVFDAGTGRPASLNREARRLVDGLNAPGRPPEELLEALTCRFSDGREIALAELPMKQVISDAATVRAEEVVLSVPDGRRVTLLVNATPIHAADGAAESMVVTLQGPGVAPGAGAAAGRVPEHGEPRAAGAADLDQGVDGDRAARLTGPRPGGGAAVLPHHRRAGRSHGRPHRRPPRRGAHRLGHADGRPRAGGCRRPGRPGQDHLRERRRPPDRPHRPGLLRPARRTNRCCARCGENAGPRRMYAS